MSIIVDKNKCTGCKGLKEQKCVQNCPGDLMAIGADGKSYIRSEEDCWDCMVCVKLCPSRALTTKLPYQLADYKATLVPFVSQDSIKWICTDSDGKVEEFVIKTREV